MKTSVKTCFKCGKEKPLSEFYRHPGMKDGYIGKCKECARRDSRENRAERIEDYRAYDRARGNRQTSSDRKEYQRKNPEKRKAHNIVNNAIRDGKIIKHPCCVCNSSKSVAHHQDYTKPLSVVWLCQEHHIAVHHGKITLHQFNCSC